MVLARSRFLGRERVPVMGLGAGDIEDRQPGVTSRGNGGVRTLRCPLKQVDGFVALAEKLIIKERKAE